MTCPQCFSDNVQAVAEIKTKTQGYGCCSGLLGYIILGPLGLLCGLCGMGDQTATSDVLWVCSSCGHKFK